MQQITVNCPFQQAAATGIKLEWKRTRLDYVEWVYALCEILNIDDGKASLKTLFEIFNPIFGLNVHDYAQYFKIVRNRKRSERTALLDLQKQLLIQRMENLDNK
jgi:hypothetical protein